MKPRRQLIRITTLTIASLLLIITASVRPACAAEVEAESDAERYVLEQLQNGEQADLNFKFPSASFPLSTRQLRGSFIAELLTNRGVHLKNQRNGISIGSAIITGRVDMSGKEILSDVSLWGCNFDELVDLSDSHFVKTLELVGNTFNGGATFAGTIIDSDFRAFDCVFQTPETSFERMRVGRDFSINQSTFVCPTVAFTDMRVGGSFDATNSKFVSSYVLFERMRVDGSFHGEYAAYRAVLVSFNQSHFADFFLNGSTFHRVSTINLAKMQANLISFDSVNFENATHVVREEMAYKRVSALQVPKLEVLLSYYDPEFYGALETSFRTRGYADEADYIFVATRRAIRRQNCPDFWRKCNPLAWGASMFQDLLAGYGKRLQYLLGWSLVFLLIGMFVFRSEKGMKTKDRKDGPQYAGKYKAFWYSLDLFLPIIKLGETDVWTPKDNRKWALLYKKIHIIIGSLFVPIGLAALTGIIK